MSPDTVRNIVGMNSSHNTRTVRTIEGEHVRKSDNREQFDEFRNWNEITMYVTFEALPYMLDLQLCGFLIKPYACYTWLNFRLLWRLITLQWIELVFFFSSKFVEITNSRKINIVSDSHRIIFNPLQSHSVPTKYHNTW